VRSIVRDGAKTTIRYRSGLVEVVTPSGGILPAGGPETVGPPALGLTLGNQRVVLSGLGASALRRAARALSS
jgi:hypothetical protein